MQITALEIIVDGYERCNRLSPGETLSADDAAFGLRKLNLLVDEMSANNSFLYLNTLTSNPQTGPIILGVGPWAALSPGDTIFSMTANNMPMAPISMAQYNMLYVPSTQGLPYVWAADGLSTIYLWPVPAGQTIKIQTRSGVQAFADYSTVYTVPDGYKNLLGASLAVRIAPAVIGKVPPELLRAEKVAAGGPDNYEPAILNVPSFTGYNDRGYSAPRLFG
jgi:hypothetical protein